jgi:hypothetical protein
MKRTLFAFAVAALALSAASVSQAAPIAPLPASAAVNQSGLTKVQYWWHHRHWHHCGWWHHHRWHCW